VSRYVGARRGFAGLMRSVPTEEEDRMAQEFTRGDRVEWNFRGVRVVGTVRRRLTSRTVVNGRVVAASKEDPRYLVRSEKTGKETTRRGESLRRLL
jgi:Hypervirulence associated proteins TUDOR domain